MRYRCDRVRRRAVRWTSPVAAWLALVAGCATPAKPAPAAPPATPGEARAAPPARPTLVVLVAVDQLRADYFTRWDGQLSGGLARFWRKGTFYTDGRQDHAITETSPGHSTMLSGRWPAHTGIPSNGLGLQDPSSPLVGAKGEGASPQRFRGTTLADWMRAADSGTRILSVARKDRGAILPLGRARGQVLWYAGGTFATSTYYMDTLPRWVGEFHPARAARELAGAEWRLLLPDSAYPEPDSVSFENGGTDIAFPHRLSPNPDAAVIQLPNYPVMDSLTLALALHGIAALGLGRRNTPDLLVLGLSTTDNVGHRYGPESRELHDQVLRLDRSLGWFLDSLAALVPPERTLLALTGDHGVMPYPEWTERFGHRSAGSADLDDLVRELNASVGRGLRSPFTVEAGLVYGDLAGLRARGVDVDSLADAFARAVAARPGVARVFTPASLAAAPAGDVEATLWRRAIPADLGWLVCASVRPGWVWAVGRGLASHGTTQLEDQRVPIAFLGPGIPAQRIHQPASTTDIAPTLAALLGVRPLERLDGHPLAAVVPAAGAGAAR